MRLGIPLFNFINTSSIVLTVLVVFEYSPLTFKLDFDLDFDEAGSYEIGLLSKANQNDVADFETTTESYSLVDISGSYMLNMANNDLNLFWSVSNLFDKEYVDHLSRLKNLNLHDIGRNISVGLKYSF